MITSKFYDMNMTSVTGWQTAPGWYDDGTGQQRWWDGSAWQQYAPEPEHHSAGPATARKVNVRREAIYTRQQKGHSIIKAICLDWVTLYIRSIYWTISPNHYWHF